MKITEVDGSSDEDEEYIELEIARRESMRQFDKNAFGRRDYHYASGSSSHQTPPRSKISRSATIYEKCREVSIFVEQTSKPVSRLAEAKIELEKSKSEATKN